MIAVTLVAFECDDVVAASVSHGLNHMAIAIDRVGRHHAAFERYAFEQLDCSLSFAAFTGFGLGERHNMVTPHTDIIMGGM